MSDIEKIDSAVQRVALHVFGAVPEIAWTRVVARIRMAPSGKATNYQLTALMTDGRGDEGFRTVSAEMDRLSDAVDDHWHLTQDLGQPRWYMMTVTVERSGKYAVDFEYRDDYQEGDISKPLPDLTFE